MSHLSPDRVARTVVDDVTQSPHRFYRPPAGNACLPIEFGAAAYPPVRPQAWSHPSVPIQFHQAHMHKARSPLPRTPFFCPPLGVRPSNEPDFHCSGSPTTVPTCSAATGRRAATSGWQPSSIWATVPGSRTTRKFFRHHHLEACLFKMVPVTAIATAPQTAASFRAWPNAILPCVMPHLGSAPPGMPSPPAIGVESPWWPSETWPTSPALHGRSAASPRCGYYVPWPSQRSPRRTVTLGPGWRAALSPKRLIGRLRADPTSLPQRNPANSGPRFLGTDLFSRPTPTPKIQPAIRTLHASPFSCTTPAVVKPPAIYPMIRIHRGSVDISHRRRNGP